MKRESCNADALNTAAFQAQALGDKPDNIVMTR